MGKIWEMCQILCVIFFFGYVKHKFWNRIEATVEEVVLSEDYELCDMGKVASSSPYHVAITTKTPNKSQIWCGGTLVSKKHVLTAAHCLESSNSVTTILHKSDNTQYIIEINKIKKHPKWQPKLLLHDIALIELPRPTDLPDLGPIDGPFKVSAGKFATMYGWDRNGDSQSSSPIFSSYEVRVIKNKDCARTYGSLITKYHICAERKIVGKACHGYSGGGLVLDGVLVGVVSFGADNCDTGYPVVNTRVSKYRKWIKKHSST